MKVKLDISMKAKSKRFSVSIKGEPLVVETEPSVVPIADAMADDLKQRIEDQPGKRWDRTGTLKGGIRALETTTGASVNVPEGRLETAETRQRFADEVMRANPFEVPAVDKAIGQVLDAALRGKKSK